MSLLNRALILKGESFFSDEFADALQFSSISRISKYCFNMRTREDYYLCKLYCL